MFTQKDREKLDENDRNIFDIGLLNEQSGANIRNELAHGILGEAACSSGACLYFGVAVIKLLTFTSIPRHKIFNNSEKLKEFKMPSSDSLKIVRKNHEKNGVYKLEFIKNPVVAEFLGFASNTDFTESDLEKSILSNLQKFLMELGKGYAFVARQQHIHTEKQEYFIDLVFYNYILKCFVLIDLKTHKITHQDIGQMDMYIRMYDELKRSDGDNPTSSLCFVLIRMRILQDIPFFMEMNSYLLPSINFICRRKKNCERKSKHRKQYFTYSNTRKTKRKHKMGCSYVGGNTK